MMPDSQVAVLIVAFVTGIMGLIGSCVRISIWQIEGAASNWIVILVDAIAGVGNLVMGRVLKGIA